MKKLTFIVSLIIAGAIAGCGNTTENEKGKLSVGPAEIVFLEYDHHFGKVKEGEKVSKQFTFENKGTGDLVLNSVTTTCGCTVPKYDAKPIPPGGQGKVEVVFDTSGRVGIQTKSVTVKSNASTPIVLLRISAEVESTE